MTDHLSTARKLRDTGAWFQWPMALVWALRGSYEYYTVTALPWYGTTLQVFGLSLMTVCVHRIYKIPKPENPELITSDVFAITRHPMYHGMFFADFVHVFHVDLWQYWHFWASWVLYLGLLLAAGWYQEKETLARWGKQADDYYLKTPRFFFEWLWPRPF